MTRSDRYIETTATCDAFPVNRSTFNVVNSLYTIEFRSMDGTLRSITRKYLYIDATTYYSARTREGKIASCGDRCGLVQVTQFWNGHYQDYLYECNSTVHEVQGAVIEEEKLAEKRALMAATSLSQGAEADDNQTMWGAYFAK